MVFLMDTKNKALKLERIRRRCQFSNRIYANPVGASGSVALWWMDSVSLDVRFRSKNLIRCTVGNVGVDSVWTVSFIYAPPSRSDRKEFWKLLINQARSNYYLWQCVGDFNQVGSMWEKQGGLVCNRS